MPDDIGVRVWRYEYTDTPSGAHGYMYEDAPNRDPYDVDPADPGLEPGIWIPLDAESLARLRERIELAIGDDDRLTVPWGAVPVLADAVLAALGLDPS